MEVDEIGMETFAIIVLGANR